MRIFKNIFLFISALLLVEILCLVILIGMDAFEHSFSTAFKNRRFELQTAWTKAETYGTYDPVLQVRHAPGGKYRLLDINENGFIANKHTDPLLTVFPDKPPHVYRVVLLGGSMLAGTAMPDNNFTVAARLEDLFSQKKPFGPDITVQVLNFGAAGGYSGAELVKFFMQLVYYQPDVVVSLDGFNDFWNVMLEYRRQGLENSVLNWSDYSYKYFELMNGYGADTTLYSKFMTYTTVLIHRFKHSLGTPRQKRSLYSQLPFYRHSKWVKNQHPLLDNVLAINSEGIAAYAAMNNIGYIAYLQPTAVRGKTLTESERYYAYGYIEQLSNTYHSFTVEEYVKFMTETFDAYAMRYAALSEKYKAYPNVRFIDLANAFLNEKEQMYSDVVHYTVEGSQSLAARYYPDVAEVLAVVKKRKLAKSAG